jgi:hypothetical protein
MIKTVNFQKVVYISTSHKMANLQRNKSTMNKPVYIKNT